MPDEPIQLRDQVGVVRRRWRIVAATVILAIAVGLLFSFLQTPTYVAETDVRLADDPSDTSLSAELVATEASEVTSFDAATQVIDTLSLDESPSELVDTVTVSPAASGAAVLSISVARDDPSDSAAIANELASTYLDPSRSRTLQRLAGIDERMSELDAEIADVRALITDPASPEAVGLRSEVRRLRAERQLLVDVRASLDVALGAEGSTGEVITPALEPSSSSSPRPLAIAALAAVIGLLLGVGLAYLRDHFDDVVRGDSTLRRDVPELPVLGSIPHWRRTQEPAALHAPHSPAGEAYWSLGAGIRFLLDPPTADSGGRTQRSRHVSSRRWSAGGSVVLVSSPWSSEGKTSTAVNLAVVAAGTGLRVVLVDADLRRPHVGATFGLNHGQGLSDVLNGTTTLREALTDVGVANLVVLPAGTAESNPAAMLTSAQLTKVFDDLQGQFDLVVLDSSAILAVADSLNMVRHCDLTLLVVRDGVTRGRRLSSALERIEQIGGTVAGIVLNDVRTRTARNTAGYDDHLGGAEDVRRISSA